MKDAHRYALSFSQITRKSQWERIFARNSSGQHRSGKRIPANVSVFGISALLKRDFAGKEDVRIDTTHSSIIAVFQSDAMVNSCIRHASSILTTPFRIELSSQSTMEFSLQGDRNISNVTFAEWSMPLLRTSYLCSMPWSRDFLVAANEMRHGGPACR